MFDQFLTTYEEAETDEQGNTIIKTKYKRGLFGEGMDADELTEDDFPDAEPYVVPPPPEEKKLENPDFEKISSDLK